MHEDPAIDREDLEHDAFINARQGKLAHIHIGTFYRRRRRDIARRRKTLRRRGPDWWQLRTQPIDPSLAAIAAERDATVRRVVNGLPSRLRRVATLLSAGLCRTDIARKLHVSSATVCRDVQAIASILRRLHSGC